MTRCPTCATELTVAVAGGVPADSAGYRHQRPFEVVVPISLIDRPDGPHDRRPGSGGWLGC